MAGMVHEIVAGYDGSPGSARALEWAVWEARARGLALTVCHAWAPGDGTPPGDAAAAEAAKRYGEHVVADGLRRARARIALLEAASQAQLLVVGARGRGGLRGMVLGSVSLAVLHYALCPVSVVRPR